MKQPSKTRLLVASGLIALLLGIASVLSANADESKASLVAVKKTETTVKKKSEKSKSVKKTKNISQQKVIVNKKTCSLLRAWAKANRYTEQVRKRKWPYLVDLDGDGQQELVLAVQCTKKGYDVPVY